MTEMLTTDEAVERLRRFGVRTSRSSMIRWCNLGHLPDGTAFPAVKAGGRFLLPASALDPLIRKTKAAIKEANRLARTR